MRVRAYPGAEVVAEVPREVQAKDARSSSRPTASGARPHVHAASCRGATRA